MHTPEDHGPEEIDTSKGFEQSDVRVTGILVFLTALGIFVAVSGVVAWGVGKLINYKLAKDDGPANKWTQTYDIRTLGNLPNNPDMQNKVAALTSNFPTPRVQTDDGNDDVAELHAREDLLLDHYTWADKSKGTVRIPIERAMQIIAAEGLPQASTVQQAPLMSGDAAPHLTEPLTTGFARTGYELDQAAARTAEEKRRQ